MKLLLTAFLLAALPSCQPTGATNPLDGGGSIAPITPVEPPPLNETTRFRKSAGVDIRRDF